MSFREYLTWGTRIIGGGGIFGGGCGIVQIMKYFLYEIYEIFYTQALNHNHTPKIFHDIIFISCAHIQGCFRFDRPTLSKGEGHYGTS